MHSLASRVLRQAAAAGGLAVLRGGRRFAGGAAPLQLRQHAHHRARPAYPSVTAIAVPFRQGLGNETAAPLLRPTPFLSPAPDTALPWGRLGAFWQAYLCSLERNPLLTKAITSFVCVVIGDSLAQIIGGGPYNATRVLRLAAYSSTVAASVGHYWHRWLEAHVHPDAPSSSKAICMKTLLDQLVLSPVMLLAFFSAVKLMEGRPDAIMPYLHDKYMTTLLSGYALWFPYNMAAFKWIPQDLRILAGNTVGIAWGTYMSVTCINSGPSMACPATAAAVAAAVAQAAQRE